MRRMICRGLRLEMVAGLSIMLAMPAMALAADNSQPVGTQTTLTVETHDKAGRTQATVAATVTGADGLPATGPIVITDQGKQIAGAALNADGQATLVLALPAGSHSLAASYVGDVAHQASVSEAATVQAQVSATPGFQLSLNPTTMTLTAGQTGTATASLTPQNAENLTAPMFVTLSCSGLPDQTSCTFTPENVEILPNATTPVTSSMVLTTQAGSNPTPPTVGKLQNPPSASPIAWAFLFPGALALAGLAWGGRRRRWLNRLSLLALVGLVTLLGTTACSPRYNYFNHGPPPVLPTPAGTYTVTITAQTSNGVTATTQPISMVLTVK